MLSGGDLPVWINFRVFFNIFFNQVLIFMHIKMRKQIVFEQNSPETCLINIKNIFGFSINYVEDKIKKHAGKWDRRTRKFEIPLKQMGELAKQLQTIDRSYYIEQIPCIVGQMLSKWSGSGHKVKRQILVDEKIVKRYEYIDQNVIKSILNNSKGMNANKNYRKILIITMEYKAMTWMQRLSHHKCKKVKFIPGQPDIVLAQDSIWVCSYQQLWAKADLLPKYCFQTIIADEAQNLAFKLNSQQEAGLLLKKYLLSRHFTFPIITKLHFSRIEILIPLLSLMLPQVNMQWFSRRYRKQNMSELNFLIKNCSLTRDLSWNSENEKGEIHQHFFDKIIVWMSEQSIEKIKSINKKNSQIEQKKILEDPLCVRHKNERIYLQSILDVLRNEKVEVMEKVIQYYCISLNVKLAIIIQTSLMYRSIQNYLCEHQIAYCHYQQHQEICQFNQNPTKMVCLIKTQYLLNVNFSQPLRTKDEVINAKLINYEPEQYFCLSGVRHVLFPDIDWLVQINRKQECIRQLFRYSQGDIIRHYFILKGSYEEKWMKKLQQIIIKFQIGLKIKEDLASEDNCSNVENEQDENKDPVFGFSEINLAKVQEEYSHLKRLKGVTDIDEQFDRLQFEALQQKLRKQSKKNRKLQKAKQKEQQRILQLEQRNTHMQARTELIEVDSEQQYELFLKKKSEKVQKSQNLVASIYEPVHQSCKNISEAKSVSIGNVTQKNMVRKGQKQIWPIEGVGGNEQNRDEGAVEENDGELLKQGDTEEVQIIQVRKPKAKAKIPKPKSQNMSVILRPSVG